MTRKYRVYRPTEQLRKALVAKREACNVRTVDVLNGAVSESLPLVVQGIRDLGLWSGRSKKRPARWPVDDELLGALRVASRQTGVPASKLLMASLTLFTKGGKK